MRVEGPNGPNLGWSIDVIAEQIKHMTRMVDDLLDVSRITRGTVVLQKEPIELARVVELADPGEPAATGRLPPRAARFPSGEPVVLRSRPCAAGPGSVATC